MPLPERYAVQDLVPKRIPPPLRHTSILVCLIDGGGHYAVGFGVLRNRLQVLRIQRHRRIPFHPIGMVRQLVRERCQREDEFLFAAAVTVVQNAILGWTGIKKAGQRDSPVRDPALL